VRSDRVEQRLRRGFDEAAKALGSTLDPEQRPAADRLSSLGAQLEVSDRRLRWRRRTPVGVYLHGPVGRGKTWLVDVLLDQFDSGASLRLHAYDAARRLHRGFALHSGSPGATDRAIDELLEGVRLLFLDELHAHDPGDAMLLSRVLLALPKRGAVLVATSNYRPHCLLPDPRHHSLVLPLVSALEQRCDVVEVSGPIDHRAHGHGGARPGWSSGGWAVPGSASQRAALQVPVPDVQDRVRLDVGGRALWALSVADGCVQFHFTELCAGPTSVGDLIEIADRFRTVVVSAVPPLASQEVDVQRRFGNLIDVFWDQDVRLVVLAADRLQKIVADAAITDYHRMTSRLQLLPSI
jgi:cell division protein ZapE